MSGTWDDNQIGTVRQLRKKKGKKIRQFNIFHNIVVFMIDVFVPKLSCLPLNFRLHFFNFYPLLSIYSTAKFAIYTSLVSTRSFLRLTWDSY